MKKMYMESLEGIEKKAVSDILTERGFEVLPAGEEKHGVGLSGSLDQNLNYAAFQMECRDGSVKIRYGSPTGFFRGLGEYILTGEDAKKEYLNNQRYIITILSVIEKLSAAGYLVFVSLTPQDIEVVYKSLCEFPGSPDKIIERIKYPYKTLQLVCPDFESKGFVVTEDLIRLVKNDFKSEEQRRHEETISKANEQIKHTRCTLIITLITFIVNVAWNIVSCLCC